MKTVIDTLVGHGDESIIKPWIVYIISLTVLSLIERASSPPETNYINIIVDHTILWGGMIAALIIWIISSVQILFRWLLRNKRVSFLKLLMAWIILPSCSIGMVSLITRNIDGGRMLMLLPILGLFLSGFVFLVFLLMPKHLLQKIRTEQNTQSDA